MKTNDTITFDTSVIDDYGEMLTSSVRQVNQGDIVDGRIIKVEKDYVTVDIDFKTQGQVSSSEFSGNDTERLNVGEVFELYLERIEDRNGQIVLSREKAQKMSTWKKITEIYEKNLTINGVIMNKIKGGLAVDVGVVGFLPGSQIDLRPIENINELIGTTMEFEILKINKLRENIVLSHRSILEKNRQEQRKDVLKTIKIDAVLDGIIKNITDYGIFVDLGGLDGLVHISDVTWGRLPKLQEVFRINQKVEVIVINYDAEKERVSLSLKHKKADPWLQVENKYQPGTIVDGRVTSVVTYGVFVEIIPEVEGLVHISEMSWTKKLKQPDSNVEEGDTVKVVIKEIDIEKRRISLSMREVQPNPWLEIAENIEIGSVIKGEIRNVTDFGIFVAVDEVEGLVHRNDVSWQIRPQSLHEEFNKGEEATVKVLSIDPENCRLSLGIKQLTEDPWKSHVDELKADNVIKGTVQYIIESGVFIRLWENVEGFIHKSYIGNNVSKKKLLEMYPMEKELLVKIIKVSIEERKILLAELVDKNVVTSEEKTS